MNSGSVSISTRMLEVLVESKWMCKDVAGPLTNHLDRICVDTGRGCSLLLTSPLAASQNFEVIDLVFLV